MNKHLADFVLEENGEDTLLIIYYAGHGVKDKTEKLRLVGYDLPSNSGMKIC
jgi:hypothetical protein